MPTYEGTNAAKELPPPPMQGGIVMPPCHCDTCRHHHETINTRLTFLEAGAATYERALREAGLWGTPHCGCFPVEWNPHNKAVCCHQCGRNIAIPKARIVYDEGGA